MKRKGEECDLTPWVFGGTVHWNWAPKGETGVRDDSKFVLGQIEGEVIVVCPDGDVWKAIG